MAIIPDVTHAKEQSGSVPQAPEGWHEMTVSAIEEKKNMKGNTTHFVAFVSSAGQARANFLVGIGSETNPKALEIGLGRYKGLIAALLKGRVTTRVTPGHEYMHGILQRLGFAQQGEWFVRG